MTVAGEEEISASRGIRVAKIIQTAIKVCAQITVNGQSCREIPFFGRQSFTLFRPVGNRGWAEKKSEDP